jgi:hypothetical protein
MDCHLGSLPERSVQILEIACHGDGASLGV